MTCNTASLRHTVTLSHAHCAMIQYTYCIAHQTHMYIWQVTSCYAYIAAHCHITCHPATLCHIPPVLQHNVPLSIKPHTVYQTHIAHATCTTVLHCYRVTIHAYMQCKHRVNSLCSNPCIHATCLLYTGRPLPSYLWRQLEINVTRCLDNVSQGPTCSLHHMLFQPIVHTLYSYIYMYR